jgi:hypothetical protein
LPQVVLKDAEHYALFKREYRAVERMRAQEATQLVRRIVL